MTKKIVLVLAIILSGLFISTYVFAENGMQKAGEDIRNVVGGAENVMEDVAGGAASAVKDGLNKAGETTKNVTNNVKNGVAGMTRNDNMNNNGYTAQRTSTTPTFAGMSGTVWTWFILAIVALAIVGLVWYYSTQRIENHNNR